MAEAMKGNSETEMRRVICHAADKLAAVEQEDLSTTSGKVAARLAMTYAEAVLRMLASYLRVTDPPDAAAERERIAREVDQVEHDLDDDDSLYVVGAKQACEEISARIARGSS